MKHTPGPWVFDGREVVTASAASPQGIALIARNREEWVENALLIAAAPDLLAALLGVITKLEDQARRSPLQDEEFDHAYSALNNAHGGLRP